MRIIYVISILFLLAPLSNIRAQNDSVRLSAIEQFFYLPDSIDWNQNLCQEPLSMTTAATLTLLGSTELFWDQAKKENMFIREETQLWRRNNLDNKLLRFDNYLQYLPIGTFVVLKFLGVPSPHNHRQILCRAACCGLFEIAIVNSLKYTVKELRPDRSSHNSFPSGHTASAFMGAEMLRLEYGETSAWIPAAGYAVALFTGFMRIYNDRHWAGDVLAGAGLGIFMANLSFWINGKIDNALCKKAR